MGSTEQRRAAQSAAPSKVLGNALRELDRFLSVLIDEVAAATGIDDAALARLRTRRNTANKLRWLLGKLGQASPDHLRLRALGRARDCFFHCGGWVRRADHRAGASMTTGWWARSPTGAPALQTFPIGGRLRIDSIDIDDICRFYDRIAGDLVASSRAFRARRHVSPRNSVAFSRNKAHNSVAIVACDGL